MTYETLASVVAFLVGLRAVGAVLNAVRGLR